ncbi:MAG: vWA domain-containing protein [Vulcanimicrobiota bacterium]
MNFINPGSFIFLLLAIPIIIFYLMKLRRKELKITTTFLWDKVMREAKVDSFFQKLKFNILLLFQLLILGALTFALARPFFASTGSIYQKTIFIIDTSASMATKETNGTRFDLARQKINNMLDKAQGNSSFMLLSSSNSARVLSSFTNDKNKIKRLLSSLKTEDTPTDLNPALYLAFSLKMNHPDAGIILLGDKLPDDDTINLEKVENFNFIPIGEKADNVGITSFEVSRTSPASSPLLFVKVENFGNKEAGGFLEIFLGEDSIALNELNLKPEQSESFVFTLPADYVGLVKAELSEPDALETDNRAYGLMKDPGEFKILLVSNENLFLTGVLTLMPGVSLDHITPGAIDYNTLDGYKLVIWNDTTYPSPGRGNHLFINSYAKNDTSSGKIVEYPRVLSWDRTHPILRFIDFSNISISAAKPAEPPENSKVLIEGPDIPLAYLVEEPGYRGIHVNFDLLDSNWPLDPSFPIFFANIINYLGNQYQLSSVETHKTGEILVFDFLPADASIEIESPRLFYKPGLSLVSGYKALELKNAGVYRVETGEKTMQIPVNLVNNKESQIKPDKEFKIEKEQGITRRASPLIKEIWPTLALVGLLLLLLEWYVFNQRRV